MRTGSLAQALTSDPPALGDSASPSGPPKIQSLDVSLLVVLAVVWGSAYIFIREGIVLGASPLLFAAIRYAITAVIFGGIAWAHRESFPPRRALLVSASVGGIFIIGLYGGLLFWGEQYTTGGFASALSATAPILTVAFAYSLLPAERFSAVALGGIALGIVGTVVLVFPDLALGSGGPAQGPLFILAAFVSTALGTVLLRRFGGGSQGLWQIGTQFVVAALLLGAAALVLPYPESLPATGDFWAALIALVVFSSVVGYYIYFTLHHRIGPLRANLVTYLLPLIGIAIGSGIFGEPVTAWEIGGFVIVLAGVSLVLWPSSRAGPAPRTADH